MISSAGRSLLFIFSILFGGITACSPSRQADTRYNQSETIESLPATYSGMLPCADCPGIDSYLILGENGFTELNWYLDRSPEPFVTKGTWELHGDTLRTYPEDGESFRTYLYGDEELTVLDGSGKKISGLLADRFILYRIPDEGSIRRRHAELKSEGAAASASGNEPFWSVQIKRDHNMTYRTPEESLQFSGTTMEARGDTILYKSGPAVLTLVQTYCRDSMSGFLFTHSAYLTFEEGREETLQGCGTVL